MVARKSGTLDSWRSYFSTANSDIFGIIEQAIEVAASDCPKEFRLKRDRIAETLFSSKLVRCVGCDRVELAVPEDNEDDRDDDNGGEFCKSGGFDERDGCEFENGGSKESKVNSTSRDGDSDDDDDEEEEDDHVVDVKNINQVSNYSFGEAEALTDVIEEESQIFREVLRIKELLVNSEDESDSVLFDSLRRLQLMALSVDTLRTTEIGKAVNGLRKHGSTEISQLARTLIGIWKAMVDEWVQDMQAVAEGTPESVNPSVVDDEEGLPSPPLDDEFLFSTQPTSMELSQFFDGMDDDGNPRNSGEFYKNRENGRRPSMEKQSIPKPRPKQKLPSDSISPAKENKGEQFKKQEVVMRKLASAVKPNKSPNRDSRQGRPTKQNVDQKVNNPTKIQQRSDKVTIPTRPLTSQQDKLKGTDEAAVRVKLEATKRKLQERYQQAENAKRQRTVQVMELQDLPKQRLVHKNPHAKPGNHNRHWANGRH